MASFEQLPAEIIEEILFYTSPKGKLELAKVCRRLNAIALLHLFQHSCDIPEPTKNFVGTTECRSASHQGSHHTIYIQTQRRLDAFSGLSIAFALDLRSIDTLQISMSSCFEDAHVGLVTEDYHRLLHTVKRLEHVRKVSIEFDHLNIFGNRNKHHDRQLMEQRKGITVAILNTILEKGCEELTLHGSSFMPWNIGPRGARLLSGLQNLIPSLGSGSERVKAPYLFLGDVARLPRSTFQASKLKNLQISGLMFFYPPLSYWTYQVLSIPTLTSFSLWNFYIDESKWAIILSWLNHPLRHRLLDLTVKNYFTFPFPALIDFFSKLTNITHLKLTQAPYDLDRSIGQYNLKHPKGTTHTFFPNLVSIIASINWATFLCPETVPRPNLKFIRVNLSGFGFGASVERLRIFLNPSFQRQHQNHGGSSTVNEDEFECFLDIFQRTADNPIYTADNLRRDFSLYNDSKTRESGFEVYDCVTGLWVNYSIVSPASEVLEMFCRFLGWWKRLRVVRFVSEYPSLPPEGRPCRTWTDSKIQDLLKVARVRCPGLREFVIDEKTHRVHEG
ncbi:hypothetical protein BDN72DRAFT_845246 [Pluteus cervinus]|uniref:Uncharacterized protein n=1 Tax=Pluteus cervinus TaxID=181527 RepID=A0ACD3AJU8_9AGAR|nr:hypothetical protein BDN72DRAFT_845246 [Pluteus cervinus]